MLSLQAIDDYSHFEWAQLLLPPLFIYAFLVRPIYQALTSPLASIPGPFITRFTKHYITILEFFCLKTRTLHQWHVRYGPIVRVSPSEVSFISPLAVKQIYQDPTMEKDVRLYRLFQHFGEDNAFTTKTKEEHGWRRKGCSAPYTGSAVVGKELRTGIIREVVSRYLTFINTSPGSGKQNNSRLVDIYQASSYFSIDVVTAFLFGKHGGTKTLTQGDYQPTSDKKHCETGMNAEPEDEWWKCPSHQRRMVSEHYAFSLRVHTYLYVEYPMLMAMFHGIIDLYQTLKGYVSKRNINWNREITTTRGIVDWGWRTWMYHWEQRKAGRSEDCVAENLAALVERDEKTNDKYAVKWTKEAAASELMDQMLAGMDTTTDTLTFLIHHISLPSSSHIQRKLHEEVTLASATLSHLSLSDGDPEWLQRIQSLPYLDAVLKETLRLYTAIPVTLPRVVPQCGKMIDGVFLKPGTVVGTFAYGIHRDKAVFGEDVEVFRPERWLEQQCEDWLSEEDDIRKMKRTFWAFGSGGRACIGKHLTVLEMKMLLVTVYSMFTTEVINDKEAREVKISHSHWTQRKTFRDVLPFKEAKGIIRFVPRH